MTMTMTARALLMQVYTKGKDIFMIHISDNAMYYSLGLISLMFTMLCWPLLTVLWVLLAMAPVSCR
jgi:hypothetical protein